VIDASTGTSEGDQPEETRHVNCLALNPTTGRLATGGTDGTVQLWEPLKTGPSVAGGL